jgi:hypothetical protein
MEYRIQCHRDNCEKVSIKQSRSRGKERGREREVSFYIGIERRLD